jgi:hypothetical protein
MSAFLSSLKADLLDRRKLPALVVLGGLLVAALVYVAIGGGSSSSSVHTTSAIAPTPVTAGLIVKQAPTNANQPVAETTSGSSLQKGGPTRNPFTPLSAPAEKAASSSSASSSSGSASSSSSSSGGSSSPSGSSTSSGSSGSEGSKGSETPPAKSTKPAAPAKPKTVYETAVEFGVVPSGTPVQSAQLKSYANLKLNELLPSSILPLVVFRGVTRGGKSATFTVVGEVILRGAAACLPSPSQCQTLALGAGKIEELEYTPAGGTAVVYALKVVSITSNKAKGAAAHAASYGESKSGLDLLTRAGLTAIAGLRLSGTKGVLILNRHRGLAARAHASARHASHKH